MSFLTILLVHYHHQQVGAAITFGHLNLTKAPIPEDQRACRSVCGFSEDVCRSQGAAEFVAHAINGDLGKEHVHGLGAWLITVYRPHDVIPMVFETYDTSSDTWSGWAGLDVVSIGHGAYWQIVRLGVNMTNSDLWSFLLQVSNHDGINHVRVHVRTYESGIFAHGVGHGAMLREVYPRDQHPCLMPKHNWTHSADAVARAELMCLAAPSGEIGEKCATGLWMTYNDVVNDDRVKLRDLSDAAAVASQFERCLDVTYVAKCGLYMAKDVFAREWEFFLNVVRPRGQPTTPGIAEVFCPPSRWGEKVHKCFGFVAAGLSGIAFYLETDGTDDALLESIIDKTRIPFIPDFTWCSQLSKIPLDPNVANAAARDCIFGTLEPVRWRVSEGVVTLRGHDQAVRNATMSLCGTLLTEDDVYLRDNHPYCAQLADRMAEDIRGADHQ